MSNAAQAKDPSMDDILSSIRQIISEEEVTEPPVEEAVAGPSPEPVVMPEPIAPEPIAPEPVAEAAPAPEPAFASEPALAPEPEPAIAAEIAMPEVEPVVEPSISDAVADMPDLDAPLELSSDDALPVISVDADIAGIEAEINDIDSDPVVGGDIAFDDPGDPLVVSDDTGPSDEVEANSPLSLDIVDPDDVSFDDDDIGFADSDSPGDSNKSITMPDTDVRDEMVEDLLSPATEAIASAAFSNLSALSLSTDPGTIEDLIRAMLRPMLKQWLDDNLPTMVERLVQDEIERVSRR